MSGHTKGPWAVIQIGYHREPRIHADNERQLIAIVGNAESPAEASAEWEANAALIAAAPEMRDALERAREYFAERAEAEYFTDRASPVPNEEMRILVEIDEALAKAEGRP